MTLSKQSVETLQKIATTHFNPDTLPEREDSSIEGYLASNKIIPPCPRCGGKNFRKNGKRDGRQRFRCVICGKTFGFTSNTPFYRSKQEYTTWGRFIHCVETKVPLREAAELCGISTHTACKWRQRYLASHTQVVMEIFEELLARCGIKEGADLEAVSELVEQELDGRYRGRNRRKAKEKLLEQRKRLFDKLQRQAEQVDKPINT